jgi:hypothetical protein
MARRDDAREVDQTKHLARVRALSQEVKSAISAIERNDLQKLNATIAIQENICNELGGAKWLLPPASADEIAGTDQSAEGLIEEIRQAHAVLTDLNRVYAGVLKRSQRSLGLIAAIYRNEKHGYDKDSPALNECHTWSCEV